MAKQAAPKSKAGQAADAAKKAGRLTGSMLVWILGIGILAVAVYFIFKPSRPLAEDTSPQGILESYSEFVRPYIPPSQSRPGADSMSAWKDYFDDDSVDWFEENADALSWVAFQRDPEGWKNLSRNQREAEALVYLLRVPPLQGGFIDALTMGDQGLTANASIRVGGTSYDVEMIKDGDWWRFTDLMGKREELEQTVARINLPS